MRAEPHPLSEDQSPHQRDFVQRPSPVHHVGTQGDPAVLRIRKWVPIRIEPGSTWILDLSASRTVRSNVCSRRSPPVLVLVRAARMDCDGLPRFFSPRGEDFSLCVIINSDSHKIRSKGVRT